MFAYKTCSPAVSINVTEKTAGVGKAETLTLKLGGSVSQPINPAESEETVSFALPT